MSLGRPKPRVVVVTTYFRPVVGGVESNAERLARYLLGAGFGAHVLTKRVTRRLPDIEDMDGVRVERIGPCGDRSAAGKWRLVPAATEWLARERSTYDIVCCIDCRGTGVAAILARALTGRPVVLQAQTTGVFSAANADPLLSRWHIDPHGRLGLLAKACSRVAYGRADAFACISREIEREALTCGMPRDRVHYLPNAIDMARFHPASDAEKHEFRLQFDLPSDAVVCLFVGRLSREKGLMDLMEAWRSIEHAILLVAGPDMEGHAWNVGPAAREFVTQHNLGSSVRFLGSVSDVASLLRGADVVIQPSHFEALGLSAIEALATGVPVVASAVGGLLEFIVDGENGKLCRAEDPVALAVGVREIVEDGAQRRRLAAAARASVLSEYDEQIVFARFATLLERLVEGRA
jgi:glycosyltransferase involved in cell wall biosynthesis